ncbi:MAG: 30S ribosomal protein S6 [candidate division Zixibacteria bacterium]|nr:30S ribosomal protein S6 [candidate division Zixibacteria bacterium]
MTEGRSSLRQYETALIFDAQLEEPEFDGELKKVVGLIESNSGQIVKTDHWGVRKLAYPIRKRPQGYYVFLYYEAPPDTPRVIERALRINEHCLRFMTVVPEFPFDFEKPEETAGDRKSERAPAPAPKAEEAKPEPEPPAPEAESGPEEAKSEESADESEEAKQ